MFVTSLRLRTPGETGVGEVWSRLGLRSPLRKPLLDHAGLVPPADA